MSILLTAGIVVVLVALSAVCSGLNVALMALDVGDLRRKAKLGDRNARRVLPLRRNTHLTLAAILLTNIAAVSATSLVLEGVIYGVAAGILSTLLIVVFGEILPQAYFSRRPLKMTSRFVLMLRVMSFITYPISKPLQYLLDKLFQHEPPRLASRRELGMIISEHLDNERSELDDDEVEIMQGALQLSEKRVRDIMIDIADVYWLAPSAEFNSDLLDQIKHKGWSRVPVFNQQLTSCFGVLLMKDLVGDDFDDRRYRVDDLPLYPAQIVGSMTALDTLFRKFIRGGTHLIPVEANDHIVGIVTIEDLLEEIVGHEIEDETDKRHRQAKRST